MLINEGAKVPLAKPTTRVVCCNAEIKTKLTQTFSRLSSHRQPLKPKFGRLISYKVDRYDTANRRQLKDNMRSIKEIVVLVSGFQKS